MRRSNNHLKMIENFRKNNGHFNNKLASKKKSLESIFSTKSFSYPNSRYFNPNDISTENNLGYLTGTLLFQISKGNNIGKNLFSLALCLSILGAIPTINANSDAIAEEHPIKGFPEENSNNFAMATNSKTITLREYLDTKTLIDPHISIKYKKITTTNCERLKDKIDETVKIFPHTKKHIIPTIKKDSFRIICTTEEKIPTLGRFFSKDNNHMIFFNVKEIEKIDPALINHEFMHANHFLLHQTKPCKTLGDLENQTAPVYPVNEETIKKYNEALDAGDRRVEEFAQLWKKELNNQPLNKNERDKLEKYKKTSEGCLLSSTSNTMSQKDYESLIDQGWKDGKENSLIVGSDYGDLELTTIRKVSLGNSQYQYIRSVKPTHKAQAVLLTPGKVKNTLKSPPYKDSTSPVRIAEREAYTFEDLSEEAIKTFYKEAWQLRRKYIKKCADKTLNQRAVKSF